jgi:hypothetical protein
MTRRLRFAALAAVVALALGACANNDAKESDVVNAMEDAGLETEQAECIGSAMQDEFGDDQGLFNDIADAVDTDDFPQGDSADYPDGTAPVIEAILADCVEGESPSAGEGDEADTDTTATTAASEGEATTTTTAASAG